MPNFCRCGCGNIAKGTFVHGHNRTKSRPNLENAAPFKIDGIYCRLIPLTRGFFAIVNASDYAALSMFRWYVKPCQSSLYYAVRQEDGRQVLMHHVILPPSDAKEVDHWNGIGLDNRRLNLRLATHQRNAVNQRRPKGEWSSKYKGVSWNKKRHKWTAQLGCDNQTLRLGAFENELDAARAYDCAALKLYGEFARINRA